MTARTTRSAPRSRVRLLLSKPCRSARLLLRSGIFLDRPRDRSSAWPPLPGDRLWFPAASLVWRSRPVATRIRARCSSPRQAAGSGARRTDCPGRRNGRRSAKASRPTRPVRSSSIRPTPRIGPCTSEAARSTARRTRKRAADCSSRRTSATPGPWSLAASQWLSIVPLLRSRSTRLTPITC